MHQADGFGAELGPDQQRAFGPWLTKWRLVADGEPIVGPNSRLLPVRRGDRRLMLKAEMQPREVRAAGYLEWLGGVGAAEVLAREDDAVLMERVLGERSVVEMEDSGDEAGALRILCEVAGALHAPRATEAPEVLPLSVWIERLHEIGASAGGVLQRASLRGADMLTDQRDQRTLHGDLHHWNVLDGGRRGWLTIDPNGLVGERAFEFALMVLPTNLTYDTDPNVLCRRAHLVAQMAGVDPRRLLAWVVVQAALWEAWSAPGRRWMVIAEAAETALDL